MTRKIGNIGLPDDLHRKLTLRAALNQRTVAGEVRALLTAALQASTDIARVAPQVGLQPVVKIVHPCPTCGSPVKIVHVQLWRCLACGSEGDNPEGLPTQHISQVEVPA